MNASKMPQRVLTRVALQLHAGKDLRVLVDGAAMKGAAQEALLSGLTAAVDLGLGERRGTYDVVLLAVGRAWAALDEVLDRLRPGGVLGILVDGPDAELIAMMRGAFPRLRAEPVGSSWLIHGVDRRGYYAGLESVSAAPQGHG